MKVKGQFAGLGLSTHQMGSRNWIQVVRFKPPHQLLECVHFLTIVYAQPILVTSQTGCAKLDGGGTCF